MSIRAVAIALLALLLLLVSRTAIAQGTVRVVPCDEFPSIQSALDVSLPGDTVSVLPGTYSECLVLPGGVNLLGSGASDTVISPWGKAVTMLRCLPADQQGSLVAGLTFGMAGTGIVASGAVLTVDSCVFGSTGSAMLVDGDCTVTGCTFYANTFAGLSISANPDGTPAAVLVSGNSFVRRCVPALSLSDCTGMVSGNTFTIAPRTEVDKIPQPVLLATRPNGLDINGNTILEAAGDIHVCDIAGPCTVQNNTLSPGGIVAYASSLPAARGLRICGNSLDSRGIRITGLPCEVSGNTFSGGVGAAVGINAQGAEPIVVSCNVIDGYEQGVAITQSSSISVTDNVITQCSSVDLRTDRCAGTVTGNAIAGREDYKMASALGVGIYNSAGLHVGGNQVTLHGSDGIGSVRIEGGSVRFEGNLLSGNDGGLSASGLGGTIAVVNNVVTRTTAVAGHAVQLASSGGQVLFANNTVAYNLCPGVALAGEEAPYGLVVRNSIFWANATFDIEAEGTAPVQLQHVDHCVVGTVSQAADFGPGCLTTNPMLADPSTGDYRLAEGSPCVNAGGECPAGLLTDFYGGQRVVGGTIDIGAAEMQATVPTPESVVEEIADLVLEGSIDSPAIATALVDRIQVADRLAEAGQVTAAANAMAALINQIRAQRGKHIAAEAADGLIAAILQVMEGM